MKFLSAVMILVWASVFHASNLEVRKAPRVETNKADDELIISLPKGWTTKRDVMGNQLLSEFEKPSEGQRPVKALLMFSNQGLKTGSQSTLETSASFRSKQICYHASECEASEFKKTAIADGYGLMATIKTTEPAGKKTYLVILVKSPSGDHWSAVLSTDQTHYPSSAQYFNEVIKSSIRFKQRG